MKRSLLVVKGAVLAAALLVAITFGLRAAVQVVSHSQTGEEGPPAVELASLEREIDLPSGAGPVRIEFPVSNSGQRRLIVRSLRRPCCDGPAPEPTLLAPGQSARLVVEVDPATLRQRGEHTEGFGTNDPARPEFWLTVRLSGAAPAAAHSGSNRSVLVKRP